MSNDMTIEDVMSGSCKRGTPLRTESGDAIQHCPGCLCQSKRLYCDECSKSRRKLAKNRREKTLLGTAYTILVAVISAGVYHYLNKSCRTSKEESLIAQWMNSISKIYA